MLVSYNWGGVLKLGCWCPKTGGGWCPKTEGVGVLKVGCWCPKTGVPQCPLSLIFSHLGPPLPPPPPFFLLFPPPRPPLNPLSPPSTTTTNITFPLHHLLHQLLRPRNSGDKGGKLPHNCRPGSGRGDGRGRRGRGQKDNCICGSSWSSFDPPVRCHQQWSIASVRLPGEWEGEGVSGVGTGMRWSAWIQVGFGQVCMSVCGEDRYEMGWLWMEGGVGLEWE